MRSVLNWLRTSVKSGFAFAAATFLAGIGAVEGGVTTLAKWEMTVAIPSSTTGTTYSPPGTPSNQAGTPSSGLLTGSASAILSAYHAVSATTYTSPAGNGSQYSFASNNWSPNDYYQIYLPTTGYSGISVSWDQARSGTGPAAFKLQMSTNGTSFTDLLSYTVLQSGGTGAPGTWNTSIYDSSYTNTFSLPGTGGIKVHFTCDLLMLKHPRLHPGARIESTISLSLQVEQVAVAVVPSPNQRRLRFSDSVHWALLIATDASL